jgi:hypothetical protein
MRAGVRLAAPARRSVVPPTGWGRCDNGCVSDPTWETRAGSRGERPPPGAGERRRDESPDDDWHLDDVDWFEEAGRPSSVPDAASRTGDDARVGRAGSSPAADRDTGGRPSALTEQAAAIRRRRIAAIAVLGVLFVVALVIPLVVFSGGGENAVEPTPYPATTPLAATTAPRTTTLARSTTTTTSRTTTQAAPLRVTLPDGAALSRGDRGTAVVQLQKGLAALGFAVGEPDGVFGATTEAAVVDFQQSNNLPPDGVVGTDTARLLNTALTSKSATE